MPQETSTSATKPQGTATGKIKPTRRRRGGFLNFLLFVGIIGAVALFFWAEQQRRDALSKLEQTEQQLQEIKESTERSGQQVADEVLGKVRQHINLPEETQPTVATIIDVDRLRETSDFYKEAKNGDHLILTETRAILYNPETDRIVDVVPVMLNPEDETAPADGEEGDIPASGTNAPTTGQQATPAAANSNPGAQTPAAKP
jgi:cell division septation protein DedD